MSAAASGGCDGCDTLELVCQQIFWALTKVDGVVALAMLLLGGGRGGVTAARVTLAAAGWLLSCRRARLLH